MWSPYKKPAPAASAQEAPVSRIAAAIIHQAIRENAASIQIVPSETGMRVDYLKEGVWRETMRMPKQLEPEITAHLKEMAGLPVGYRMALQGLILIRSTSGIPMAAQMIDAAYEVPIPTAVPQPGEQDYDVHLFITPTRQGEKITLKIEAVGSLTG